MNPSLHKTTSLVRLIVVGVAIYLAASPAWAAKILHRGNGAEPYSLDPHRAISTAENNIIGDLLMGLYTEDADGHPILGAAESAETSADGLTWTFKIRDHTWSNGVPVSADDFVYAFRRVLDPNTAAEYASVLYPIKNALKVNKGTLALDKLGVQAPNAKTLVIELEHPSPFLPELLTHYTTFPIPKTVVEKFGSDWTRSEHLITNGPYTLGDWRPHDHVRLVKNPKFYDAANVKIDEVVFFPTDDDNAALKRYRAGEIDTQERWPISEYKWLTANIPSETRRSTQLTTTYISFNLLRKPFNDIRVRQALAMAIDNQALATDIYQGVYGEAATSFLAPGTANVDHSAQVAWAGKPIAERRTEAMRLLAQAGYGPNNPLKFSYRYIGNSDIKRAAVAMQSMWRDVGVQVELANSEAKVHWNLLQVRDFDVAYNTWSLDYNDAKNLFFQFQAASVQMNNSAYDSPAFEELLHRADREADATARGALLGQANATLLTDLPSTPLFYPYVRQLVKSYVLNWTSNPRNVNRTRWLDIGEKPGPGQVATGSDAGTDASEGGFWSWLGSWFSWDAWQKWWNS
ncbi:MAG: peptide ABC transporter substrate-binding protein [Alphaproteobacteria bacterium]|nr:peptide ABC transporter substrate-binding protein [Alphaproteobacteria bacterium]